MIDQTTLLDYAYEIRQVLIERGVKGNHYVISGDIAEWLIETGFKPDDFDDNGLMDILDIIQDRREKPYI